MFSRRCQIVTTVAVSLFLVGFNVILYQKQPVPSTTNKRQHRSFNLLEDVAHPPSTAVLGDECTLDYINDHRLPQNHPCVIETIRQDYLNQPAADEEPLVLRQPNKADQSVGQAPAILRHLNNKTRGFFVECGALDGEYLSNTLYMERTMKWTGILVEADQKSFKLLMSRKRKSYALPVCLSLKPYPTEVTFKVQYAIGSIQEDTTKSLPIKNLSSRTPQEIAIEKANVAALAAGAGSEMVSVQCFPLYSILLAVGRTQVDFFSLDVEGHELRILKTIPWHKVDIKTLSVEWDHVGRKPLEEFMEAQGYYVFGRNTARVGKDLFFAKKSS